MFFAFAMTDTGSKSLGCALISTLETYDDPETGNYAYYTCYIIYFIYMHIMRIMALIAFMRIIAIIAIIAYGCAAGWLESVGSRVVYELDYKKSILYVVPIHSILGKLPVVPAGDTGTIQHRMRNVFSGAPGDSRPGAGDGCRMWFINSLG
jgi:hypothetical protein